ncbi:MAG: amidohydrolase family protein [Planctomycetes bacterium]|nr:amidohydrolase family protein [Planctomycetota bacterium]
MGAEVFFCARVLGPTDRWFDGGGLEVSRGRIVRVLTSKAAARRACRTATRAHDLGEAWLVPGLVDAHAHLELTALSGVMGPGVPFGEWVRTVIARRAALSAHELDAAVRAGARRLLETGTTTVGDIDTCGASARTLASTPLRHVLFRETLDAWDPRRTAGALAALRRALPPRARRREGLSPHAPFTVSRALLSGVAALAKRRRAHVAVHWSETENELAWLEHGAGPLAPLLGSSPRRRGLELLDEAGLLGPGLSLVHGNHPHADEPRLLAERGVSVVHCPGCHAWFGRARFPFAAYEKRGVRIALGTDSLASNSELDMRGELARFADSGFGVPPARIFRMATLDAAAALGLGGEVGELAPGRAADFVAFAPGARVRPFEHLVRARPRIFGVWIAGRRVVAPSEARVNDPCT